MVSAISFFLRSACIELATRTPTNGARSPSPSQRGDPNKIEPTTAVAGPPKSSREQACEGSSSSCNPRVFRRSSSAHSDQAGFSRSRAIALDEERASRHPAAQRPAAWTALSIDALRSDESPDPSTQPPAPAAPAAAKSSIPSTVAPPPRPKAHKPPHPPRTAAPPRAPRNRTRCRIGYKYTAQPHRRYSFRLQQAP